MSLIDRLSILSDEVICHILSLLPTKISVSTSVLARRWRFLWAHVLNLDFDHADHNSQTMSFLSIVNRVILLRRVQDINTFHIYYHVLPNTNIAELDACITAVLDRNVRKFYLDLLLEHGEVEDLEHGEVEDLEHGIEVEDLEHGEVEDLEHAEVEDLEHGEVEDLEHGEVEVSYVLPHCLFTCKTLVDLRLGYCTFPSFLDCDIAISLPSLKKLYLYRVIFAADDALPRLLSCCPLLDELIVEGFLVKNFYHITSPTVKSLSVDFGNNFENFGEDNRHRVKINAPTLEYLELSANVASNISAHVLTSLVRADIKFDYAENEGEDLYILPMLEFLDSLCKVRCLKFAFYLPFVWENPSNVRFDNCTRLELAADWLFLMKFLERVDNLEVLIIGDVSGYHKHWVEPERVPTCLLSSLGMVRFDGFDCMEPEINMVGYLLTNAQVLKRMEIHTRKNMFDSNAKYDALQKIGVFQQRSEAIHFAFY